LILAVLAQTAWAGVPAFQQLAVTTSLRMGYQLVAADLNADGRLDIVVIDERSTDLAWFENPSWERHILAQDVPRAINLEVGDFDGDGKPEVVLAHHFETNPEKSIGTVVVLQPGPDVRQPWTRREIDRVPTAHRIRTIEPRGDGKRLVLLAPLVGLKARAPDYADRAPVFLYQPGSWQRSLLTDLPQGVLHSIAPVRWDRKGEALLTASFSGLQLFRAGRGGEWKPTLLARGEERPCPECGSSEVKMGRLGATRFLAAIEPWHGSQVVVYTGKRGAWSRQVIEAGMVNGHALAVGDLDADGRDEIVAGFRGQRHQLYVFSHHGGRWERTVIDAGGMAAADCKIADFNGDGRADIACSGASTGNVKIYMNQGARRPESAQ
jgi:hypothetical protein